MPLTESIVYDGKIIKNLGKIEVEKFVTPLTQVDFYLPDINLVIEANGPAHFW